ncbi:MAG: aminotransferase class III-fold pyridoxal phosphate-dependent enzyme [Rhodospirillales bacterium]|nr:aminotransferase class III-fold pyridoxal phosphate-dependent enzyme [Rhodospirillales bacterium]
MTSKAPSALLPTYARADLAFASGEGAWLTALDGQRYLDFGSGVAVVSLGHAHPHLVAALTEQASRLWHVSNLYRIPEGERLAARLVAATFADVAVSGRHQGRPQLAALMRAARQREIGCVLVWKFDRFARSTRHLLEALAEFDYLGVRFVSVQDQIDTASPMGRAMFTIIGAMAELSRR